VDILSDIDETATTYFAVKIANGKVPEVVHGGEHDGLRYFVVELGETYWLTEYGLLSPLS